MTGGSFSEIGQVAIHRRHLHRRVGFTLIEIVVAMVLLATLLSTGILAIGQTRRQMRLAEQRLDACVVADMVLDQLHTGRGGIPTEGTGAIAGRNDWVWMTRVVGGGRPLGVDVQVVRFSIVDRRDSKVIVSVDLVR